MAVRLVALCILSTWPAGVGAQKQAPFKVSAQVVSGWPRTPSAAQSLEWIRDVDVNQASSFLHSLGNSTLPPSQNSGELAAAEALLTSSSARTYHELLVHNSYYSPRIESLRSLERTDRKLYGKDCPAGQAWALLWSSGTAPPTRACSAEALQKELRAGGPGGLASGFAASRLDLQLRVGSAGVAVIYGAVSSKGLLSLAPLLQQVAQLPATSTWQVVFRHADGPVSAEDAGADLLTGYGFELAIKSSEYKTHAEEEKEDDKTDKEEEKPDGSAEDAPGEAAGRPLEDLDEGDTDQILKAGEIKDIGLQATIKIQSSPTPLLTLMRLSQNFPAHVVGLSRISVKKSLRAQGRELREMMRDGAEVFSMNGRLVRPDHSDLSLFPLMQTLHPFFVGVERLVRLGVPEKVACEILKEVKGSGKAAGRVDWRSKALPPSVYSVMKDRETQRWSSSLRSLFFGFGGLSPVRLPLYNIVFVFNPGEVSELIFASSLLKQMPLPAELHFVMLTSSGAAAASWDEQVLGTRPPWLPDPESRPSAGGEAAAALAPAYAQALQKGRKRAQSFVASAAEWAQKNLASKSLSTWPDSEEGLQKIKELWLSTAKKDEREALEAAWSEVARNASRPGGYSSNCSDYVASTGVPVPSLLVNGKIMLKGAYDTQHALLQSVAEEQQRVQQAVYMGTLSESSVISDFFASQGVLSAYHPDIAPDMAERGGEEGMKENLKQAKYHLWPAGPYLSLAFVSSLEPDVDPDREGQGAISFYHVLVLRSVQQVYLLAALASHLLAPARDTAAGQVFSSHLAVIVEESEGPILKQLGACVRGMMALEAPDGEPEEQRSIQRQKLSFLKFMGLALPAALSADPSLTAARVADLCRLAVEKKVELQLRAKAEASLSASTVPPQETQLLATLTSQGNAPAAAWVCNGRRIDLQDEGAPISARHVHALELLEGQYDISKPQAAEPEEEEDAASSKEPEQTRALSDWLASDEQSAALPASTYGLVAALRSEVLSHAKHDRFTQPAKIFNMAPAAFQVKIPPAKPDAASPITVYGILDPLSTTAQSASAALALFGMAFNAEVNLVLNPPMKVAEYPLKRYYREVVRWPQHLADGRTLKELQDGAAVGGGKADFTLTTQHTLTAAVHVLPTWLVTAQQAEHDMDNLRPVDVLQGGSNCDTTYVLRQLYVEGQAMILGDEGWPIAMAKGMQFEITGKGALEASDDTIVMGNLGYFQVRGNPGFYQAALKSGLSNETFELAVSEDLEVSSYITPPHQLRVRLKPGKSHDDLFVEEGSSKVKRKQGQPVTGLLGALQSIWGGYGKDSKASDEVNAPAKKELADGEETIHIFSVASGHLYEKLLSIMILSVRNNTKNPLHFWFIDNFLSPKFKAFIPQLAARYDFKYDFVTYKWPSWLNPQSEKQRLIWAYKILFLDVLFPQDVPKIIFIDADQVVRADVKELWDLDLKGNVYGFVPMGDSNPDTEGFRFWKQGYWKSHLGNKPYHISALFVVDLIEFRRTSIGESLRGVYNQLSRDPNSLANLDQDLPNFAQHQVPIFTLPSEWLWCETWCSQESKKTAKTIDLCQNPLTKEPKIVMAKRIISEWQTYHDEVQHLQSEFEATAAPSPGGKVEL